MKFIIKGIEARDFIDKKKTKRRIALECRKNESFRLEARELMKNIRLRGEHIRFK